jgi:hypothetical protein
MTKIVAIKSCQKIVRLGVKQDLHIYAPSGTSPTIIVPRTCHELLIRDAHERMFHLAHAKVYALLKRSYYWPTLKANVRKCLEDGGLSCVRGQQGTTEYGPWIVVRPSGPRSQDRPRRWP